MMASKKGSTGGMRAPLRGKKKKAGIARYVAALVGLVVIVVAVVLITSSGSKQPAKSKSKTSEVKSKKSSKKRIKPKGKKATKLEKQKRREEKAKARRERRRSRSKRTKRTSKGGYSRKAQSASHTVQMILVDGSGQRYAVVDNRRLKTGDHVGGRRIVQVGSDDVKVEYHGKTYSVRVGQQLY